MRLNLILLLVSLSAAASALATSASPSRLRYFDIKGAAEMSRILFALAGEEYVDDRFAIDQQTFSSPAFQEAKESGELKMNLNRAPVLITPSGATIGQSKAIERYLSRRFGLMGETPEDEAMIDCIAEHCRDVKDAAMRKGFSRFAKGKTDEEKAQLRKEWFETDMPQMLGKIEDVVKETGSAGYAYGENTSYADVVIWALLRDCVAADLDDTAKAAKQCSALNAIADNVAANDGVGKYLKERPESMW
jgi:glutathione S-transferase